jgi:hypothetical protein
MIERYRVVGSGDVVELDDPRRDPRLVGNLSWRAYPQDSPLPGTPGMSGSGLPWESSTWGELIANCICAECQAQRVAATN